MMIFGKHRGGSAAGDLGDGRALLYRGQRLTARISHQGSCRRVGVARRGSTLHIQAGPGHTEGDVEAALGRWYRKEARRLITDLVRVYTARAGATHKKIFIKDQKTRWGSCSRQGNLNFNFRLVMAPPDILEYIVAHEVCHLVHQNHSRDYWSLVASHYPRFREARKWLRSHGPALQGTFFLDTP